MLSKQTSHLVLALTDPQLSETIREAFLQESFQVSVAANGEEAIRILSGDRRIHLLLIDSDLPGLNGYETVQYLRASGFSNLIVMLMAWFNIQSLAAANLVGCDEFIAKPVDVANLLTTARQQLLFHPENL